MRRFLSFVSLCLVVFLSNQGFAEPRWRLELDLKVPRAHVKIGDNAPAELFTITHDFTRDNNPLTIKSDSCEVASDHIEPQFIEFSGNFGLSKPEGTEYDKDGEPPFPFTLTSAPSDSSAGPAAIYYQRRSEETVLDELAVVSTDSGDSIDVGVGDDLNDGTFHVTGEKRNAQDIRYTLTNAVPSIHGWSQIDLRTNADGSVTKVMSIAIADSTIDPNPTVTRANDPEDRYLVFTVGTDTDTVSVHLAEVPGNNGGVGSVLLYQGELTRFAYDWRDGIEEDKTDASAEFNRLSEYLNGYGTNTYDSEDKESNELKVRQRSNILLTAKDGTEAHLALERDGTFNVSAGTVTYSPTRVGLGVYDDEGSIAGRLWIYETVRYNSSGVIRNGRAGEPESRYYQTQPRSVLRFAWGRTDEIQRDLEIPKNPSRPIQHSYPRTSGKPQR